MKLNRNPWQIHSSTTSLGRHAAPKSQEKQLPRSFRRSTTMCTVPRLRLHSLRSLVVVWHLLSTHAVRDLDLKDTASRAASPSKWQTSGAPVPCENGSTEEEKTRRARERAAEKGEGRAAAADARPASQILKQYRRHHGSAAPAAWWRSRGSHGTKTGRHKDIRVG